MKDDHGAVLLEDLHGKFDVVTEVVSTLSADVQSLKGDVAIIKEDMGDIKADVKAIKAAVTDQTQHLNREDAVLDNHEGRLSTLARRIISGSTSNFAATLASESWPADAPPDAGQQRSPRAS